MSQSSVYADCQGLAGSRRDIHFIIYQTENVVKNVVIIYSSSHTGKVWNWTWNLTICFFLLFQRTKKGKKFYQSLQKKVKFWSLTTSFCLLNLNIYLIISKIIFCAVPTVTKAENRCCLQIHSGSIAITSRVHFNWLINCQITNKWKSWIFTPLICQVVALII